MACFAFGLSLLLSNVSRRFQFRDGSQASCAPVHICVAPLACLASVAADQVLGVIGNNFFVNGLRLGQRAIAVDMAGIFSLYLVASRWGFVVEAWRVGAQAYLGSFAGVLCILAFVEAYGSDLRQLF